MEGETKHRNPEDYKHIAAWGRMLGSFRYYVKQEQAAAFEDGAPLDAIYKNSEGEWERFSGVTNPDTIRYFRENFPELAFWEMPTEEEKK